MIDTCKLSVTIYIFSIYALSFLLVSYRHSFLLLEFIRESCVIDLLPFMFASILQTFSKCIFVFIFHLFNFLACTQTLL